MRKDDKNQYINDVTLLCHVTVCEQERVPRNDITKGKETSSSKLDPEPEFNKNENPYPVPVSKKLNQNNKQETRRLLFGSI